MAGRRRRKGKVTKYNRCVGRGMKKGLKMRTVAPKCARNKSAFGKA